jgi:LCP family protein required for cell wall assembly
MVAIAVATALLCGGGVLLASKRTIASVRRLSKVDAVLSPSSGHIINYLLVGSDSRSAGDPNTGATGGVTGSRSDSIMLLRYDTTAQTASILSIPRDLWVKVPGHSSKRRINSALSDGPDVLVRTVQQELRLPVQHFVEIDFTGFESLVNALGGVVVCFAHPARDKNTGLRQNAGCHRLGGKQALAYARSRHYTESIHGVWVEDPTSDLGRSKRQRDFVNRCLQAAVEQVKANPFRAGALMGSLGNGLRIDGVLDPLDAAISLRSAVGAGIRSYALPVRNMRVNGADVLALGKGADAVLAFFRGQGSAPKG